MRFFNIILQVWGVFFNIHFMSYWFFPLVALGFLACIPRLFRVLVAWR